MLKHPSNIEETISVIFQAIRFFKQQEAPHGKGMLSHVRFETLSFVSEANRPSMKDLAKYFRIEAPSATSLVEHLVKAKQLARVPDLKDRRQVHLVLTSRGRRDLKRSMVAKRAQWRLLLKKLSSIERIQFTNTFKKLSRG
jgi:DNA-binding MarR family transcriptional regulator